MVFRTDRNVTMPLHMTTCGYSISSGAARPVAKFFRVLGEVGLCLGPNGDKSHFRRYHHEKSEEAHEG